MSVCTKNVHNLMSRTSEDTKMEKKRKKNTKINPKFPKGFPRRNFALIFVRASL